MLVQTQQQCVITKNVLLPFALPVLPEGLTLSSGMDSQCLRMVGGLSQPCWISEVAKGMVTQRGLVAELVSPRADNNTSGNTR